MRECHPLLNVFDTAGFGEDNSDSTNKCYSNFLPGTYKIIISEKNTR
jgi:hypothetical protein